MKTLILITSIFLISFIFSSCHLLDYIIPEEYIVEDDNCKKYSEFVWVSHTSGVQCGIIYFSTLESAVTSLKLFDINVYSSYSRDYIMECECGKPMRTFHYAKIKSKDLEKAIWDGWRYFSKSDSRNFNYYTGQNGF